MDTLNFGEEIMQHETILRPFAFSLTKNREASEDLIQDTFYRALSNAEKFSEGTNVKAWLFTIMRNIFINDYRRKQKSHVITDSSENQFLLNSTKKIEKNEAERRFLSEEIEKALKDVSTDFTTPFLMYYQGYHYQEIAEHMNLPLGTVKSRIFFARKELQNRLKNVGIHHSDYNK